jgi:hypothetical protein
MTLYAATTAQTRNRPAGAHRKPTRWDRVKGWIRAPRPKEGDR